MRILELSPSERMRSRKVFAFFSVFNSVSFLLLTGNIITLYLLRLGASGTIIGMVSSFTYASFFFIFLGRNIVGRAGVCRLFCCCWTLRYVLVIPMIFSPILVLRGMPGAGFGLIIAGSLAFQMVRGIGMVSNSPIIGDVSEGRDRGDYLSLIQILNQGSAIVAGLCIAFFLGSEAAPIERYSMLILAGVVLGLIGGLSLFRMPGHTGSVQSQAAENFFSSVKRAFAQKSFRMFMLMFFLIMFLAGMGRPFTIVYAANVYDLADNLTMYLSAIGYLGAMLMGFIAKVLLDRLGSKPILIFFTGVFLLGIVFFIIGPGFDHVWEIFLFLTVGFLIFNLGSFGQENAAQAYFYSAVEPQDQMNWGILYFFVYGLGGAFGSFAGGILLDTLTQSGLSLMLAHRIFFLLVFVLTLLTLVGLYRIKGYGLYSVRSALNMLFSVRDLRAIVLTNRLERTRSFEDERKVIREMRTSPSEVSAAGLLLRLRSPSFMIRSEALRALESHTADMKIVNALIAEVQNHEYTTARTAARILGVKEARGALGVLREALKSEDYLLCAESMVALARLRDKSSIRRVELIVRATPNPLLIIFGAEALRIYGDMDSLAVLMEILERPNLARDIQNQVILSVAGVLSMDEWFYPFFCVYGEDPRTGLVNLFDTPIRRGRADTARVDEMKALRKTLYSVWKDDGAARVIIAKMIGLTSFPPGKADFLRRIFLRAIESGSPDRPELRFLLSALCIRYESLETA
ncbi:MAG: MFS transporter [Spirochaetales bacterium]|jgi:MFS family permease|nr:MFS transporter [Spirochaetales bacterium]